MKKHFTFFLLLFVSMVSYAKTVILDDALKFEPTDKYAPFSVQGARWAGLHKGGVSFAVVKSYDADIANEDRNIYMNKMDTVVFNLKGAELVERESEDWLEWTRDYLYKFYKYKDGKTAVTFNFTSFYLPYSVLCVYETEEELQDFRELCDCFQEPKPDGFAQLIMVIKNAFVKIVLMGLVLILVASILGLIMSRGAAAFLCMIACAIFLWFPLNGLWFAYIALVLACGAWSAMYAGRWWENI